VDSVGAPAFAGSIDLVGAGVYESQKLQLINPG
jgi:hypothetical protein